MKLGQNVILMKSPIISKMDHVWAKTRSLGQILQECFVCCRGHIIMKLDQHVCRDKISHKFGNASSWVKK